MLDSFDLEESGVMVIIRSGTGADCITQPQGAKLLLIFNASHTLKTLLNRMLSMTSDAFQRLTTGAVVLEEDGFGPKVYLLEDGSFLKLFRRKRFFSSEALHPYAQRFAENAAALRGLLIPAPEVTGVYRMTDPVRTAVHYIGLPGNTMRTSMREADEAGRERLVRRFGQLLAHLHDAGVYFRSLHLGNVIVLPNGELGLIDFADMQTYRKSLSVSKRKRNLRHVQRYEEDREWIFETYLSTLRESYRDATNTPDFQMTL